MSTIIEQNKKKEVSIPSNILKEIKDVLEENISQPSQEKEENYKIIEKTIHLDKKDIIKVKGRKEEDKNKEKEKNENGQKEQKENEKLDKNIYYPILFKKGEVIKQYICPLCNMIFDEPVMELCGCCQIYCKRCIQDYLNKNNNKCPSSNKIITQEPQNVSVIQFTVNILDMICINHLNGCNWKGKCVEYKHHIQKYCPKKKIKCSNKGCTKLIMRENMENHLKECIFRYALCFLCNRQVQFFL